MNEHEDGTAVGAAGRRERSTVQFPYNDLDDAIEVATAVYSNAGDQCEIDQLAGFMHQTVTSGAFRMKVQAARIFGVVELNRTVVSLTTIGHAVVDPDRERSGRSEAFLSVPLYRQVYEKYRGRLLPPDTGLEREMVSLGVAEKQRDKARQAFQRSAGQAGFFEQGRNRLVLPAGVVPVALADSERPTVTLERGATPREEPLSAFPPSAAGMHPFIQGLLMKLPAPESRWPQVERKKWLQAADNIFGLIYTEDERESE
jgi:hypothetical protein